MQQQREEREALGIFGSKWKVGLDGVMLEVIARLIFDMRIVIFGEQGIFLYVWSLRSLGGLGKR